MRLTLALAALTALAACSGDSTPVQASDDLTRDLELARSEQSIELLPAGSRTTVVSAIEQTGTAAPAPAPTRARTPVARPRPRRAAPTPTVVRTRASAPAPSPRVSRPEPQPVFGPDVISPPPPGGYKTVNEVIRNAPFPIKP